MKYIYSTLGWVFGLLFIAVGVLSTATPPYISFSGVALIAIGALFFPPFRRFVTKQTGNELSTKLTTISVIALFFVFGFFSANEREEAEAEKAAAEDLARQEQLEQARKSVIDEFNANRAEIIGQIRDLSDQDEWSNALQVAEKYIIVNDPELKVLHQTAKNEVNEIENEKRTQLILEKLNEVPIEKHEENLKLYRQLISMHPENEKYQAKVEFYSNKIAEAERIEQEAQARRDAIRSQFSAWDGSHNNLERLIKKTMKNPDSYDHVETTYSDQGDHLIVRTVYRGTNSFNAVVPGSVTAKVSINGNILEIIE